MAIAALGNLLKGGGLATAGAIGGASFLLGQVINGAFGLGQQTLANQGSLATTSKVVEGSIKTAEIYTEAQKAVARTNADSTRYVTDQGAASNAAQLALLKGGSVEDAQQVADLFRRTPDAVPAT